MKKRTTPAISSILTRNIVMRGMLSKIEQLDFLNQALQEALPDLLRGNVQAVNLENGVLSIAAQSAVWANQLHYLTPELLFRLQTLKRAENIRSIRCIVLPALFNVLSGKTYWEATKLSQANADLLRVFSESIEDNGLKQAVLALARHKRETQHVRHD